ncbi:MAG: tyrosine-type recombinase/integrase [Gallionellaceae bacterium]|nr:tyrosine-type recombinase/integrase [Gallionellaceae bacterium]
MDRGVFIDRTEAETTSLAKALERYETEVSSKKDGYEQEKYRIKAWLANPLALRSLASLRGADFAKWRDARLKEVAVSTLQKDIAVISHLFTIARTDWGMAVQNPIADITIPTEDNSRDRRLEDGEYKALIEALTPSSGRGQHRSKWMIPLVKLAIETGARQSELLALTWGDVDTDTLSITVRGKKRSDGKSRTKNKTKLREVPMSPIALKATKLFR